MLAIFSTFPVGKSESLSADVAEVIRIIEDSGIDCQTTAMGTLVEGDWDQVMELVKKCHHKLRETSSRVYTKISIDDREGARGRIRGKVASVEKRLGREVKK
jgi:uncharacterized protein (TIGR00106 family)